MSQIRFYAVLALFSFMLLCVQTAVGQDASPPVATGLLGPIGLTYDADGNLWVAEQGTGNDDAQITVITPDGQAHPVLTGLESIFIEGSYEGAQNILPLDGELWFTYGKTSGNPESWIGKIDISGFTPGDPPMTLDDAELFDIGTFVLGEGIAETNAYDLIIGPGGDLFIVDASANALIRRDQATGDLSVFATFDEIPNPTPVGPPFMHAVPTGIVFDGTNFYVSLLSGFPFVPGLASVMQVDTTGVVTTFQDGLTMATDIVMNPQDSVLTVIQIGIFGDEGIAFDAGQVLELRDGRIDTVATGLIGLPSAGTFAPDGTLILSYYATGLVGDQTVSFQPTANESTDLPRQFELHQNYPNPFNPATTISYSLEQPTHVTLKIYNTFGQEIDTLVEGVQAAGTRTITWSAQDRFGSLPSGTYFYQLQANGVTQTRSMTLLK